MDLSGKIERRRLEAIVEKGRMHAIERFSSCPELQRRLAQAELIARPGLGTAMQLDPPNEDGGPGRLFYDPVCVEQMTREHRYPEWVLCAQLEVSILTHESAWQGSEAEALALAAHRERSRRPRTSGPAGHA